MKLHEAIEKLIRQTGRPMTTTEIANELNKNKWYQKRDGSAISAFQIHGRSKNYTDLFNIKGSTVSLISDRPHWESKSETKPVTRLSEVLGDFELMEKVLLNEKNFKDVSQVDANVPDEPGLYCIRIRNTSSLPYPFAKELESRKHNILYIGVASQSLRRRMLQQELRAIGHGTFFRSIGAIFGFKPKKGSLVNKANKRNYKFESDDAVKIVSWINENLMVNWVKMQEGQDTFETSVIIKYSPLLNIAKNPNALSELSELRAECVRIANDS